MPSTKHPETPIRTHGKKDDEHRTRWFSEESAPQSWRWQRKRVPGTGADRHRRHGLPVPRRGRHTGLLAAARRRRERGAGRRARLRRRAHRPALCEHRGAERRLPVRRLPRRARPVRRHVLPHLTGGGAAPRSAAAADAGDVLAGARGRGDGPRAVAGQSHRGLRGDQQQRVPEPHPGGQRHGRAGRQPLHRHRHLLQHRHRAGGLRAGAGGARDGGGHRLLVVAGGDAPGGDGAPARRIGPRARGRRAHHPVRAAAGAAGERRHAVAGRKVRDLRRGRERLRARRGLRHRGAQAARRGASRRRPDLGSDPGHGAQPGRGEPGTDGAERAGTGEVHRGGARAGRHRAREGGLPRGARHRDPGRRPHRGRGDGGGIRPRTRSGAAPADRLRQDQHRAPGVGGGRRGRHQDDPGDEARGHPEAPAFPDAEPGDGLGPAAPAGDGRADGLAAPRRPSPDRRRKRVRVVGHQRARRARRVRRLRQRLRGRELSTLGRGRRTAGRDLHARVGDAAVS